MQLVQDNRIDWAKWEKTPPEATNIYPFPHWTDELIAENNKGTQIIGDTLPWSITHPNVRLRQGEVSLWGGINGHGKSALTTQVIAHACIEHNRRAFIASLEMHPLRTLKRMQSQVIGVERPSDEATRIFMQTFQQSYLYGKTTSLPWKRMMAILRYAHEELRVDHFVIDSLMKCGIKKGDSDAEVEFIDQVCTFARTSQMHIHIIHHARKGESEDRIINKFDMRGAGEITDAVDNVFLIFRNKRKERENSKPMPNEKIICQPDTLLICDKQRHWPWEGTIKLWLHKNIFQYIADDTDQKIFMLDDIISQGESNEW